MSVLLCNYLEVPSLFLVSYLVVVRDISWRVQGTICGAGDWTLADNMQERQDSNWLHYHYGTLGVSYLLPNPL